MTLQFGFQAFKFTPVTQVQALVRELRSLKLHSVAKKKKQKTKNKTKKTTYQIIKYKLTTTATAKLLQSCLTLHDPMDCSPPGSYVHGIVQARILEWTAMKKSSHVEGYL